VGEDKGNQPIFEIEHQERQSRLTTFFRPFLAIPGVVWISIWGIAIFFTVIAAWFAVLITGRYPQGLYDFHAHFIRYLTRLNGYYYLATDRWPGFSAAEGEPYPVDLRIAPALEEYSRVKVLFRLILAIPVYLIVYVLQMVAGIGALIAWFVIVVTGKLPDGIFQMIKLGLSYMSRAAPYYFLMTEDWPAFTQDTPAPAA
jgi:hypothetical protein